MKPPSRRMSRPPRAPMTSGAWLVLTLLAAGSVALLAWLLSLAERGHWFLGVIILAYPLFCVYRWHCDARVHAQRVGESICTFARAIGARRRDTWVVRAVHDEIGGFARYPIRPTDRLADLGYCDEDLDDAALDIARRAGRSMDDTPQNPFFDCVVTVSDLVTFLEHQPRVPPVA